MFLFTVTKPGLRQAGALALCAVCLAGTVTAAVRLAGKSVAASATVQTTIENTQDIGTYFTGYGFEVDLSTAAVDKVKIPKKWDDSFTAFNQVVGESCRPTFWGSSLCPPRRCSSPPQNRSR